MTRDVCVVGGGYTGLSAALHLARSGARTVLLEADGIASQASGRNGGQLHSGYRKDQSTLEEWLGAQHARDLWEIAEQAKALVLTLIAEHAIDCDLQTGIVVAAHDRRALRTLAQDAEYLDKNYDFHLDVLDSGAIARRLGTRVYRGGTYDASGGHFHPLKYARGLASAAERAGAVLHENSRVVAIEQDHSAATVRTSLGSVLAGRVILACDAFCGDLEPSLARYIGHVESFIVATEPLGELASAILPGGCAVADTRHVLDYYRKSADGRLLFAGREAYFQPPKDIAGMVRPRMLRVFPPLTNVRIDYAWRGTVGITMTRMPHFGRIGDRILFGHGYSGHGAALSAMGGKVLAEAALQKSEAFETLARVPAKPFPGGALLRRPLIAAALTWYKVADSL